MICCPACGENGPHLWAAEDGYVLCGTCGYVFRDEDSDDYLDEEEPRP